MAIKFEEHKIENVVGTGKNRKFVQLKTSKAKTVDEIAAEIAHNCSVTKSDVLAVMTELRHVAVDELIDGSRFYLPELGYLSLKVGSTPTKNLRNGKITGNDIYLKNVKFKPNTTFIKELQEKVRFSKSKYSSLSTRFSEDELWEKVTEYLSERHHITRRDMCVQFGLSYHFATMWLDKFVEDGRLVKETFGRQQLYSLS